MKSSELDMNFSMKSSFHRLSFPLTSTGFEIDVNLKRIENVH